MSETRVTRRVSWRAVPPAERKESRLMGRARCFAGSRSRLQPPRAASRDGRRLQRPPPPPPPPTPLEMAQSSELSLGPAGVRETVRVGEEVDLAPTPVATQTLHWPPRRLGERWTSKRRVIVASSESGSHASGRKPAIAC